jgi:hypothetical protein
MLDAIPFLRRQPIIIMFGVLAWLLAVWQLTQVAVSQGVGLYLLLAQSALWYMAYCNIAEWQPLMLNFMRHNNCSVKQWRVTSVPVSRVTYMTKWDIIAVECRYRA